jgi:hypothetical protein
MRVGLHTALSGATTRFHAVASALNAEVFLWMEQNRVRDALAYPNATHILRLPNPQPSEGYAAWADRVDGLARSWSTGGIPAGALLFQHANEVDIAGYDLPVPWDIDAWLDHHAGYLYALRNRFPDVACLAPPFTCINTPCMTTDYLRPYQGAATHSYWSEGNPGWRQGRDGGASWRCATELGVPCYITELNSNPTSTNEILAWASEVDSDLVLGACLFLPDAAGTEFDMYNVTVAQAVEIRAGLHSSPPVPDLTPPPQPEEPTVTDVYGEDLLAKFETQIGHPKSGAYDMRNGYDHPWAFFCEAGVESSGRNCNLVVVPRSSAITAGEWARQAGVLQSGEPEHGGVVYFGDAFFRDYGHTGFWNADRQQTLSTLTDGTGVGYKSWGPNTVGFEGWYRLPGIAAPRRADEPPMPSWIVQEGNPYQRGKPYEVGIGGGFARLYSSVDIGAEPLVVFGFALDREEDAMVDGLKRTIQRFERATLQFTPENDFPWDVSIVPLSVVVTPIP